MKRTGLWIACVVVLVGVGLLAVRQGYAQDAESTDTARCSLATLRGTYLYAIDGVFIEGENRIPFAAAGSEVFDGKGHVDAVASVSWNGEISRNGRYSARYTVKADCTGTFTIEDGLRSDLFIAPDGSMLTFLQTDPGFVASSFEVRGTAKRVGD